MISFTISLLALILGFLFYGTLCERVFGINPNRKTPAITNNDGVDFVPMKPWRIFLVQFLNIAGLGPIFGAIMGIFFGPSAFLWIVFGCIFAGSVHDYLTGMLSLRQNGASLPEVVGKQMGKGVRIFLRVLTPFLLVLLTSTFLSGPATLLQNLYYLPAMPFHGHEMPMTWVAIIFAYYALATVLPVDKLIGRFYPIFGGILLFMGLGIMVVMLGWHSAEMPEFTDGLQNRQNNGLPLFPMMFVSIACGAISGFHATQSPIMARCCTNERQGRWIFYGAMICEGILALVWAAAAGTFFADPEHGVYGIDGLKAFAAQHPGENIAALVVDKLSRSWLGTIGGILAIIGVIVAPITSGDTALRSARLTIADFLHADQKAKAKRFMIAIPLFVGVFGLIFVDFNIIWRYFAWTNQTLAVFTLWAGTVFLYKQEHNSAKAPYRWGYLMTLIPAMFMTMVCTCYIFIAPEGFRFEAKGISYLAYVIAGIITLETCIGFIIWARKYGKQR
ncbi:MAG: carbon starvation protein A [Bacteroidales bacterium]|nr:carbon starvation protein A [Candidatus Colicola coprequi]